jgi:hypothetical protein
VTGSDRLVVAAAPVATLGSGSKVALNTADFKSSTLPVTLTWSATDANTIASYQLQQQVKTLNGTVTTTGAFTDVTPAPTGTSVTLNLALGQMLANKPIVLNSYTFKVRACDQAGTRGSFATAPIFQLAPSTTHCWDRGRAAAVRSPTPAAGERYR